MPLAVLGVVDDVVVDATVNPDFSLDSQPGHSGRTLDQLSI